MHLTTDRILLRPIEKDDLNNIYLGLSNTEVIQYYGVSFHSLEATKEQMAWYAQDSQKWFAICSLDQKVFYGACGLNDISLQHRKAEVGLWLLPRFWNKGFMQEAMPLLCHYGFDQLKLHRIEGFVDTRNTNCKKAMTKLGFYLEGTMRDCEIKHGKLISTDIYDMLNTL